MRFKLWDSSEITRLFGKCDIFMRLVVSILPIFLGYPKNQKVSFLMAEDQSSEF